MIALKSSESKASFNVLVRSRASTLGIIAATPMELPRYNGAKGSSDIEGKAAREAASECGQRASFNGANGISDMAGYAVR